MPTPDEILTNEQIEKPRCVCTFGINRACPLHGKKKKRKSSATSPSAPDTNTPDFADGPSLTARLHEIAHGSDDKCAYGGFGCPVRRDLRIEIDALCATVKQLRAEARAKKIELLKLGGRGELLTKVHVEFNELDEVAAVRNEFDRLRNVTIRDLQSQLEQLRAENERSTKSGCKHCGCTCDGCAPCGDEVL